MCNGQGCHQPWQEGTKGILQGSVLGLILFLIYVKNVAVHLSCKYKVCADDLKLYMKVNYQADTKVFQHDIDMLYAIATSRGLNMNFKKCSLLRFQRRLHGTPPPLYTLDSRALATSNSRTDLEVTVDDALKFHEHTRDVAKKARKDLLKFTVCCSWDIMTEICKSHVRPAME